MSDKEHDSEKQKDPPVGEGERSLSNWQKLALARQGSGDPHEALASHGLSSAAFAHGTNGLASLEKRLAFHDVEHESLHVHRAASLVVGPVAIACAAAGVAAAAVAGAVAGVVAGNAAYVVNAVQTANVVWTANWASGDKLLPSLPAGNSPEEWWENVWSRNDPVGGPAPVPGVRPPYGPPPR